MILLFQDLPARSTDPHISLLGQHSSLTSCCVRSGSPPGCLLLPPLSRMHCLRRVSHPLRLACVAFFLQGCGLVVFSQHSEAAAALQTLHQRYIWPGARSPMVMEYWDPSKQHMKRRTQPMHAQMPITGQQLGYMHPTVVYQQQAVPGMQPFVPATATVALSSPQQFNQGTCFQGPCLVMPGY